MKTIAQLALFTATIYFVGHVIKRAVFRRIETSWFEEITVVFGFGLGATPLLMFYLALSGARLSQRNLLLLLGPLVLLSLILAWHRFRVSRFMNVVSHTPLSPLEKGLITFITIAVIFGFALALSKPFDVWDAVTVWGFKAKVLDYEQTIYSEAFLDRDGALIRVRLRPQYPLAVPMLEYLVGLFAGAFEETKLKFIGVMFFSLLVLAMYAACRLWFSRRHSLLACAVLVSIPFIYYQTVFRLLLVGGKKTAILGGMADLPLAYFVFLSAICLFHWLTHPAPSYLISAALFAAFAGFTKNEGLAISAVIIGTLGLFIFMRSEARSWSSLVAFVFLWLALIGPWLLFRQMLPPELALERFEWNRAEVIRTLQNVPLVARFFGQEASNLTSWGLIWVLWAVLSLLRRRQILATPLKYLYVIMLGGLLMDLMVVAFAPVAHVERSFFQSRTLARLLFHYAPLAVFITLHLLGSKDQEPASKQG